MLTANPSQATATNRNGETALHAAARAGQWQAVKALVAAGAWVDARLANGFSAVHEAAIGGHAQVVQQLAELRANLNARSFLGTTPLMEAACCGQVGAQRAAGTAQRSAARGAGL